MRPIILDDTMTYEELVADNTNGLGRPDWFSATSKEERNGSKTLSLVLSSDDTLFDKIKMDGLIKAKPNEKDKNDIYKIAKITKSINKLVSIEARQWAQSAMAKAIAKPFTATGALPAVNALKSNLVEEYPFELTTDISESTATVKYDRPQYFASILGGMEGSFLDAFGGEYKWDKHGIALLKKRGEDTDVEIRYGKNLINLNQEENNESVYDAILGYAVFNEKTITGTVQHINTQRSGPRVYLCDLSDEYFQSESEPTVEDINAKAIAYAQRNKINEPNVNLQVNFVQLWQTEQYKDIAPLEKVGLCDTCKVLFPDMGVSVTSKVIAYEYDVLNERYTNMEIGDSRSNFASILENVASNSLYKATTQTKTIVEQALDHATELITGGLGGHVVIGTDEDGHPNEILIMDTDNKRTARNVLRMNMNGIAFSQSGYNGPFTTAWTIDSKFVADFITAGTLSASVIAAHSIGVGKLSGTITNGKWKIDLDNGSITIGDISADRITAGTIDATTINVTNINGGNIREGTISSAPISSGAISTAKLADSAVSEGKLGDNSVSRKKVVDTAVSPAKTSFPNTLTQVGNNTSSITTLDNNQRDIVDQINKIDKRTGGNGNFSIN